MYTSRLSLSNQNIVEKLEENTKNKNTLKATQTWLNVWVTERKVNPNTEEFEHEQLEEESAVKSEADSPHFSLEKCFPRRDTHQLPSIKASGYE